MVRAIAVLVVLLAASLSGCGDRAASRPPILLYTPPAGDMGQDQVPDGGSSGGPTVVVPKPPDDFCVSRADNSSCMPPQASGICLGERCQLLGCGFGFGDCDDNVLNGCEQALSLEEHCGACGQACQEPSTCQQGPRGYECSATVVCPLESYDLDGSTANVCEWQSRWESLALQDLPEGLLLDAALDDDGALLLAGIGQEGRYVLRRPAEDSANESPLALETFGDQRASQMAVWTSSELTRYLAVVWPDALTLHRLPLLDASQFSTVTRRCTEPADRIVGAVSLAPGAAAVLDSRELVLLGERQDCGEAFCELGTFDKSDYLRGFYPYADRGALVDSSAHAEALWSFGPQELTACTACVIDATSGSFAVDKACAGGAPCRGDDFDAQSCGTCLEPVETCPRFEPQALVDSATLDIVYLVTRRGLIVLARDAAGFRPLARLETPFDPSQVGGPGFLAGASTPGPEDSERISLIHSSGFVRTLVFRRVEGVPSLVPLGPDVGIDGLATGAEARLLVEAFAASILAVDDSQVLRLLRPQALSGRSVVLPTTSELLGDGAELRALVVRGSSLGMLYNAFGLHQLRWIEAGRSDPD